MDAGYFHLHTRQLRLRPYHLLELEQSLVGHPAGRDDEEGRRQDRTMGQFGRYVSQEGDNLSRRAAEHGKFGACSARLLRVGQKTLRAAVHFFVGGGGGGTTTKAGSAGNRLRRPVQRWKILAS